MEKLACKKLIFNKLVIKYYIFKILHRGKSMQF